MATYIGQVQIDSTTTALVGSSLYGLCNTNADVATKTVLAADVRQITQDNSDTKFINNNFDTPLQGITIHVKFYKGNTATTNVKLQVGSTSALDVVGKCTCDPGTVISFTLDELQKWVVNDNVDTNTEYVFKTAYNATTNKAVTEADLDDLDIQAAAHKGVIDNLASNLNSADLPTASAVAAYIQSQTGGLAGLTGAMHFRGVVTDPTVTITDGGTQNPNISNYNFIENGTIVAVSGDVILFHQQEYVWTGSAWELLGDEGSYALKTNTTVITEVDEFTANTLPQLTVTETTIPNVTSAGTAADLTTDDYTIPNVTATNVPTAVAVSSGVLSFTRGTAAQLGTAFAVKSVKTFTANTPTQLGTAITVDSASGWNAGTQASLTTNNETVVIPGAANQNP